MPLLLDLVITLKRVPIFKNIPDHILADIAEIIEIEELPTGNEFITQGTLGDCLYIIKSGSVKVHRDSMTLIELQAGDIVGELAVLSPIDRTACVTTTSATVLYKIYREYFLGLLSEEPDILTSIFSVLVHRLNHLNDQLYAQTDHPPLS